jgi:integrase
MKNALAPPEVPDRPGHPLTIVRPTEKPARKDLLWAGIIRHGAGWRAVVQEGRGKQHRKQFALDTNPHVMQTWRKDTAAQLHLNRKQRATQGAFSLDAKTYLELEAVKEMPTFDQRSKHIAFWVEKFGDRQRSEIDKNEIENIYRRLLKEPRQPPHNGTKRNLRPVSVDTANKMLRALSNLYKLLDRKGTYNPVREVKELKPEPVVLDLDDERQGRSMTYGEIEKVIAAMTDEGAVVKGEKRREEFSATKIRIRCMAYSQITEEALMRLTRGQNKFAKGRVYLAGRNKGRGAPAIWTPLTSKAIAAFGDLDRHDLYGRFQRSPVLRSFKQACKRAGVPVHRVYDLRHSVATALRRVTSDGEAVDYLLQHKIHGTTIIYTIDSVPDRIIKSMAALDAHQRLF